MAVDLVAHDVLEQAVELSEVAEDDVAAVIPGEPLRIEHRGGEAAGVRTAFQDAPPVMPQTLEFTTTTQTAGPGSNNGDVRSVWHVNHSQWAPSAVRTALNVLQRIHKSRASDQFWM